MSKPSPSLILWFFLGTDQRLLHESIYSRSATVRLGLLASLGSGHEPYELCALSVEPLRGETQALGSDEFFLNITDPVAAEAVDALIALEVFVERPQASGGRVARLNRPRLVELNRELGVVERRAEELARPVRPGGR